LIFQIHTFIYSFPDLVSFSLVDPGSLAAAAPPAAAATFVEQTSAGGPSSYSTTTAIPIVVGTLPQQAVTLQDGQQVSVFPSNLVSVNVPEQALSLPLPVQVPAPAPPPALVTPLHTSQGQSREVNTILKPIGKVRRNKTWMQS
jgi:hypothetical protein